MRVNKTHRSFNGSIWLQRGFVSYGANWYATGPIRSRALLRAMMKRDTRFGAPWLWD